MSANAFLLPTGFDALVPVVDLASRIGLDAACAACVCLWRHRHVHGDVILGKKAADALELAVRWRRKRGALVEALVAAGLVEEFKGALRIVDPLTLGGAG